MTTRDCLFSLRTMLALLFGASQKVMKFRSAYSSAAVAFSVAIVLPPCALCGRAPAVLVI
jgi:hypothetical protein